MLTELFEYIVWLKAHHGWIIELVKIGGALGSAYGIVRQFRRHQLGVLKSDRKSLEDALANVMAEGERYRRSTKRRRDLQSQLDRDNARLTSRKAHAVLEQAERERADGNDSPAMKLLATWYEQERRIIAEAVGYLAQWQERCAEAECGDAEAAEENERLKRVAALLAPEKTTRADAASTTETAP